MGDNNAGLQNIYTFSKDEIVNNNHVVVASSAFHLDEAQAPDFAQPVVDLNLVAPSGGPLAVPDLPSIGPLKPIGLSLIGLGPSGGVPHCRARL